MDRERHGAGFLMPTGVAREGFGNKGFAVTVSSNATNQNLRTIANNAGYSGAGNCTITINAGVEVYSAGGAAVVVGSWPAGVRVTLVNKGTISGYGGNAGNGGAYYNAVAGGAPGGTALDACGVSGLSFRVLETMRMIPKPVMTPSVIVASAPPQTM